MSRISCLTERPPGDKNPSACGIVSMFNMDQKNVSGKTITDMICLMEERENGQGAGFAVYGLFPKYPDKYCIQVLLDHPDGWESPKQGVETLLEEHTEIIEEQRVYVKKGVFKEYPTVWRFFVDPKKGTEDPDELVKDIMMNINARIPGAFAVSGGKNMAVFKGSGWAREIAEFYKIENIKGYMWSYHSRFPTNTPGWWGGAHPFSMVGHAVVHNGEITSYGTNVEYLKELGYQCRLMTDTEPLIYLFDYMVRKARYPPEIAFQLATMALAPPYWRDIDRMSDPLRKWATAIRQVHRFGMANGPFSIVLTTDQPKPTMIGHTDRKKLRPLIAAVSEDESTFYLSSELNSIHEVDDTMDFWQPDPGKAVIATTDGVLNRGTDRDLEEFAKLLR